MRLDATFRWIATVALGLSCASCSTFADAPFQIFHLCNDPNPGWPQETSTMVNRSRTIAGLDNHGYDYYPGDAITYVLAAAPQTPFYAFASALEISPGWCDTRWFYLDQDEDAFFHTTEPAQFTALTTAADAVDLYWHSDARENETWHQLYCVNYDYYKTIGYYVTTSSSSSGPWTLKDLVAVIGVGDTPQTYHWSCSGAGCDPTKYYKIFSKIDGTAMPAGGKSVTYSWPVLPSNAQDQVLSLLPIYASGSSFTFESVVRYTSTTAPAASNFYVDYASGGVNNKASFVNGAVASTRTDLGGGLYKYSGTFSCSPYSCPALNLRVRVGALTYPPNNDSVAYLRLPINKNNRSMTVFSSMALKPDNATLLSMHVQRATSIMSRGGDGIWLDFLHSDALRHYNGGVSSNLKYVPSTDEYAPYLADPDKYRTDAAAMVDALHAAVPTAKIVFNGMYATIKTSDAVDYLGHADGMFYEYVSFQGNGDWDSRVRETAETVIAQSHQGTKVSYLETEGPTSGGGAAGIADIDKRRVSLAQYLLVAGPRVYWQYTVDDTYQQALWFPEWNIRLGTPTIPTLSAYSELEWTPGSDTVLYRQFSNGMVFYNHGTSAATITLPKPLRPITVTGGLDPVLGGDGTLTYEPAVTSLTLAAKDGVLLIDDISSSRVAGVTLAGVTVR